MMQLPPDRRQRAGATVVEFALVAPLLFMTVFGCVEIGRGMMVTHSLEEAVRSGCRVAVLRGSTVSQIQAEVDRIMGPVGVSNYTIQTTPDGLASADRWSPVTVSVTASFDDMSWLPLPRWLASRTYTSSCTMPKEYSPGS